MSKANVRMMILALAAPAAVASAAPTVGPINSALLINTHVPGAGAGLNVGTSLPPRGPGNDSGGVAAIGSVTGISGATNAQFGKANQASTFGVALAPQILFSSNPTIHGGLSAAGGGSLVGAISSVQSAVVNSTAAAQTGAQMPAALSTGVWGAAFDGTRMASGGTAFIVGRDGANAGALIMGTYSGYAANGSGGTWAKALKAGDNIVDPTNAVVGTLASGTSATATFDAGQFKATEIGGTPTYITRAVIATAGSVTTANNDVLIANGKILSGGGNVLREGNAVNGSSSLFFSTFGAFDIASNGNFAVSGNTAPTAGGTASASYVVVNGTVVAKSGDTFAGVTLPTGTTLAQAVDVNESGDYAFNFNQATGGRYLFFGSAEGTAVVALEGSTAVNIDADGDGSYSGSGDGQNVLLSSISSQNSLYMSPRYTLAGLQYVDIYFAGNGTGTGLTGNAIFKTTVLVPEPTAIAALSIGAAGLLRRRQR